ncbi:unnamed protein product [Blepharisma stoltei]|uniref:Calcium-transporting ATPase n=1 Tax=Blepharisma stoltei TaxID=1481888 RepID=A0AAU9I7E4_9CILI|nr:unnamed protein product [Blepharisma stoltei]
MSNSEPQSFIVTPEELGQMFDQDNIRNGKSLEKFQNLHGVSGLCKGLLTSPTKGISSSPLDLSLREKFYGNNHPYVRKRTSILEFIFDSLQDTVLQILIVAAIISLVIGIIEDPTSGWLEGAAILLAVFIVVCVTATNDYVKEGQFIKLNVETNLHNVIVTRDGIEKEIPAKDILTGDLIYVSPGEVFCVDGILIRGNGLSVDESSITGESKLMNKQVVRAGDTDTDPFLISGAKINQGNGVMLVCAVGKYSVLGKNRSMMNQVEEEAETPLQERLGEMATNIGKIGFIAGTLLSLVLIAHLSYDAIRQEQWGASEWEGLVSSIILGITILVVAIPEGLPLALTLAMAYSILRMKKDNIFVRHLRGCEVMGASTNILSDKTGTLTQNKMTVTCAMFYNQFFSDAECDELPIECKKMIAESVARNTTAFITTRDDGKRELVGDRTECALLMMTSKWNLDYHLYRVPEQQKLQWAFDSRSKRMTTVYEIDSGVRVYTKGAGEVILDQCCYIATSANQKEILTPEKKAEIREAIRNFSNDSLRVLSIAYNATNWSLLGADSTDPKVSQEACENGLVFLGIVGIEDPLRPEARKSVIQVQNAGVTVRMVTGDSMETAVKIARQCHILDDDISDQEINEYAMEGAEFRQRVGGLRTVTDEEGKLLNFQVGNMDAFVVVAQKLRVIARCSPEDKLLMVIGLRAMGEVVGVTGDGSNDAPALKQSDIGLAMMSGTPLAKESADIILLDDNFDSVLKSVKWGRNVYASIRKFVQFQLTVNLVALIMSIVGALTVEESPLTAVQMLWVNLIMDSMAALALATEPPTDGLLSSKPFGRNNESIITPDMYITVVSQAIYQIAVLMIILFLGPMIFNIEYGWGNEEWTEENGMHFTIFFHVFVMMQVFNEINCRKLSLNEWNLFKGFFNNWMFVGIIVFTIAFQMILVQFGGQTLKCSALSLEFHAICIAIGAACLIVALIVRMIVCLIRKSKKRDEDLETVGLLA